MFRHNVDAKLPPDSTEPQVADRMPDFEVAYGLQDESHENGCASTMDPDSGVKRGLKNRHLSMMALAGIIGPGLLVGAGGALSNGGPASLLIGFGVIGMSFFAVVLAAT